MTTKCVMAALFALTVAAGFAAAQQDFESQHEVHHPGMQPMGRVTPGPGQMGGPDAWKQAPWPSARGEEGEAAGGCPMCEMCDRSAQGGAMQMRMKQAGVPEETIERATMLMNARIHPADPQALIAFQDRLNLTNEQINELRNIVDSAQERALGILTAEQWEKIRKLEPRAQSAMEMHQQIMPQMRAQMQPRMRERMERMRGMGMMPMGPQDEQSFGRPGQVSPQRPGEAQKQCPMGREW